MDSTHEVLRGQPYFLSIFLSEDVEDARRSAARVTIKRANFCQIALAELYVFIGIAVHCTIV